MEGVGTAFNNNMRLLFVIYLIIFLPWTLMSSFKTVRFVSNSEKAEGVIIDVTVSKDASVRNRKYYPIIKFKAGDGREYKFESGTGFNNNTYVAFDSVEVIYRKDRPEAAEINSFQVLWQMPLLLIIASSIGIAGLFSSGGERQKKAPGKDSELAFLEAAEIKKDKLL